MKTLLTLLILAASALAQAPSAPAVERVAEALGARHFRVTVTSSSGEGALVNGGFYNVAPGVTIPLPKPPLPPLPFPPLDSPPKPKVLLSLKLTVVNAGPVP